MQTRYPTRRRLDISGRACRYLPRRSLSSSRVRCGGGSSDNPTQLWETTRTGPFSSAVPKTLEPGCADDCIGYVANLVSTIPAAPRQGPPPRPYNNAGALSTPIGPLCVTEGRVCDRFRPSADLICHPSRRPLTGGSPWTSGLGTGFFYYAVVPAAARRLPWIGAGA